jgi:hypothetical protein
MLRKALTLAVVTVVFGWFYGWASPWAFPKSRTAGFKYGVLHGALMPLSLPALLIGEDVPIYASDNAGWSFSAPPFAGPKSHQPAPINLNDVQCATGPIMIRRQ